MKSSCAVQEFSFNLEDQTRNFFVFEGLQNNAMYTELYAVLCDYKRVAIVLFELPLVLLFYNPSFYNLV